MLRGLAVHAHGIEIGLSLARRVGDRIAADAAVVRRQEIGIRELLATCACLGARIALRFIVEPDLAPVIGPVIAIETRE
jgi:hypothetical protein